MSLRFEKPVSIGTKKFFAKLVSPFDIIAIDSNVSVDSNDCEFSSSDLYSWNDKIYDAVVAAIKNNYTKWFMSSVSIDTLIKMARTGLYELDDDRFALPITSFDEEMKDKTNYKFNLRFTGIQIESTRIIGMIKAENITEETEDVVIESDDDHNGIKTEMTGDIEEMMRAKTEHLDRIRQARMKTLMARIEEEKLKEEYVAIYDSDGWTTDDDESDDD
jgi:hypothetical protein